MTTHCRSEIYLYIDLSISNRYRDVSVLIILFFEQSAYCGERDHLRNLAAAAPRKYSLYLSWCEILEYFLQGLNVSQEVLIIRAKK